MAYYENKEEIYFSRVREDLIDLMPVNANQKVLEVGAGSGSTLLAIKRRTLASEVVGVDLFTLQDSHQNDPEIDNFLILDVEKEELPLQPAYFDVLICGDVLEHLIDPWSAIDKLSKHLKSGGILIISVPNIRYYQALIKIVIQADFAYDPKGGTLDKTHLRFFCKKNIKDLLDTPKLEILKISPINSHPHHRFSRKIQLFNFFTFKLFEDFAVTQYLGVARKK